MSREIVDTLGGKRIAFLLVILAAFAVFAAIASSDRSAKADVVAAKHTLTGGFGAAAEVGEQASYSINVVALTAPVIGDLVLVVDLNDELGLIHNVNGTGVGTAGGCVVSSDAAGGASDVITCTIPGPIAIGAVAAFTFDAIALSAGVTDADQVDACTANDTVGAQAALTCGTVPAQASTVDDFVLMVVKTVSDASPYENERFSYTITLTNTDATMGINDLQVADVLPSGVVIDPVLGIVCAGGMAFTNCAIANLAAGTLLVDLDIVGNAPANAATITVNVVPVSDTVLLAGTVEGDAAPFEVTNTVAWQCEADGTETGALLNCSIGAENITTSAATPPDVDHHIQQLVLTDGADAVANGTALCQIALGNWETPNGTVGYPSLTDSASISDVTIVTALAGATITNVDTNSIDIKSTAVGTIKVELEWTHSTGVVANQWSTTNTAECEFTVDASVNDIGNGLYHIDTSGDPDVGRRDEDRNLAGYQHTVCLDDDDGTSAGPINTNTATGQVDVDGLYPLEDDGQRWRIQTGAGSADVRGVNLHTLDIDSDGIFEECVSWYSGNPGEQDVTMIDDQGEVIADWADGDGDPDVTSACDYDDDTCVNIGPATPLVKEWNTFDRTEITGNGNSTLYSTSNSGLNSALVASGGSIDVAVTFDPSDSTFSSPSAVGFDEHVYGHHPGTITEVIGAKVTFTISGTCGTAVIDAAGTKTVEATAETINYSTPTSVTVTSAGLPIDFWVNTLDCTQQNNSYTVITISVAYPNTLNSNPFFIPVDETVRVNWVPAPAPAKKVFLAWAGQRIILEHDWRLLPGDVYDGSIDVAAVGDCAFADEFDVQYIKGGGPGNFLPGPNGNGSSGDGEVTVDGSDEAYVSDVAGGTGDGSWNHQDNDGTPTSDSDADSDFDDFPHGPQDSCISRVLFESEDQGQVDIEAFVVEVDGDPLSDNQTKVAWVIYYMKINRVDMSLVTSVSKPLHNVVSSDWNPGNPWDYSLDVTSADWNVSKDLLVRARVSGWFLNSNPSGRPRDDSDALNVLPADRWVMPYDWPILAGGPADPADGSDATGTAENFSPQYDLMIAPNNHGGGGTGHQALLHPGHSPVALNAAGVYVLAGTVIPFHGPFSLLDLVALGSSAAVADTNVSVPVTSPFSGYVRDTIWRDGDVDKWDAPMPVGEVTVDIRGAGFIRQVKKQDVYYQGTANTPATQVFPNPYYLQAIPDSPFIPAVVAGGGYEWDTWGPDGPGGLGDGVYRHWLAIPHLYFTVPGSNRVGATDTSVAARLGELTQIRTEHSDSSISRTLVIYTDNHGEGMMEANGDFNLTYDECALNFMGGNHCSQGDIVGASTIYATADYPDFRGKHAPVRSNDVTVSWTWAGYKAITVEDGETEQFKYVVFHAVDRDGFCSTAAVSLHPVLSSLDALNTFNYAWHASDPVEQVDFLIDGGEGKFVDMSHPGVLSGEQGSVKQVPTFSTSVNDPAAGGVKEFPTLNGTVDECQAWVKVSSSLLDLVNVFIVAYDDEGKIGFDELIDFTSSTTYSLTFRWSLITWIGADGISPSDALGGVGANAGGGNITDQVTAVYGWEQASQTWLGFFPAGLDVPGANDLTTLTLGNAYWIAITAPGPVTWTVITDIN